MSTSDWIAFGALAVAVLVACYTVLANTPKETQARVGKLEVDVGSLFVMQSNTSKTLDRLVRTVDRYIEGRVADNGRPFR